MSDPARPVVRIDRADDVATITLDSPRNRNALSAALRAELTSALRDASADPAVRVVVVTHTGPVFCAGMDLKESRGGANPVGVRELTELLHLVTQCPKPVVARLAGGARGGGIGLAACADVALAVDTATFAFSEVRLGLLPAVISLPVLARMSTTAAQELMLTGAVFDAARAAATGLVARVVPADRLDAEVDAVVAALRAGAPGALAATKRLLDSGRGDTADRYRELARLSAEQTRTAEAREGAAAFVGKRRPRWADPHHRADTEARGHIRET